ncbi:MAG TPA: response regulator transcription factor [Anaerolineae bacterium]|nr:response regulator transcription factor [Anaerolineae bacterium]
MSASNPIRVFIAEDHAIVRKGIHLLLNLEPGIEVVGEASNGREAVSGIESTRPDVILMDLVMPEMDGIEAIQQVKARQPEARILVLTSFATDDKVFPAIKAGALGYLLKDSEPRDVVDAIRQVYRGESSLHPRIARKLMQELSRPPEKPPTPDPLTEREMEVLCLVAQGKSNREIADDLTVTEGTVRVHVSSILSKLHLASRTQATLYALREGLASLDDGGEASRRS